MRLFFLCLLKTIFVMEKIIKKDGKVYAVENYWQKGFEIYHYLGLDPDYVEEEKPKKNKKSK